MPSMSPVSASNSVLAGTIESFVVTKISMGITKKVFYYCIQVGL
jgi:hypothetical protein